MAQTEKKPCPRILIVDDDQDHCELMRDALLMYYQPVEDSLITAVQTGEDCLKTPLKEYDVVLLDMYLPDTTGLQLLEDILSRADVPVIFVTGEGDISVASQAIESGAQDYIVKHGDYLFAIPPIVQKNISLHRIKLEHDRLQIRLGWMLEELQEKNRQLEESMNRLKELAVTDPLTGLANRRCFAERLTQEFAKAKRYQSELSCCMIDLDHYKEFNDTLGHQMGDELLQRMAEIIRSCLRESDISARYGGDEFVLLLLNTSPPEAMNVLGRIREGLSAELRRNESFRVPVTLSVGIASLRSDSPASADMLVSMADRALYHAKETGKDRIVLFDDLRKSIESPGL